MIKKRTLVLSMLIIFNIAILGYGSWSEGVVGKLKVVSEALNLKGSLQGISGGFVDVDGDGINDMVIGAPYAATKSQLGAALVYKGDSTGEFSSTPVAALTGDDNFGFSFANIGDVDGDLKNDFAIGAINNTGENAPISGSVSIIKGGSNGKTIIKNLVGEGAMDMFGFSISSGDMNGDGKTDIVISAPFNTSDYSVYQRGTVYVYFGPNFNSHIALSASSLHQSIGLIVAAGDVNNDNISDLLISAKGEVLGYYGSANFAPVTDLPDLTVTGTGSMTGRVGNINILEDINEDGYREIAIGAPVTLSNESRNSGSVYIVKGGAGDRNIELESDTVQEGLIIQINGMNPHSRFGSSIATVDADGDSIPDIAIGAPTMGLIQGFKADKIIASGKVFLYKGKDIMASSTLKKPAVFQGSKSDEGYGTFLAYAQNGRLLIGAPFSNGDTGVTTLVDIKLNAEKL